MADIWVVVLGVVFIILLLEVLFHEVHHLLYGS